MGGVVQNLETNFQVNVNEPTFLGIMGSEIGLITCKSKMALSNLSKLRMYKLSRSILQILLNCGISGTLKSAFH